MTEKGLIYEERFNKIMNKKYGKEKSYFQTQ